ncbi:MAG: Holliday junction resolvase RuvX [Clostridia bacterium]|nr:Holliday junction resolvase RuvX [Clostridia bacterium]
MDLQHGKYMAVDYGDVRTGLAECDPSGTLASGIGTIKESGMRHTAERVVAEALARGCKRIIIGLPKNMDGTQGGRVDTVHAFGDIVAQLTDLPVVYYDERMTTMIAYRYLSSTNTYGKQRRDRVDTLSAEIILQDYLDAERAGKIQPPAKDI